jgi:hypothetical protein
MTHQGCRILRPYWSCLKAASAYHSQVEDLLRRSAFPPLQVAQNLSTSRCQNHEENTRLMGWILGLLRPGFWRIPGILNVNSQSSRDQKISWRINIINGKSSITRLDRHRQSWRSWNSAETRVNHGQIMNRSSVFAGRVTVSECKQLQRPV